MTTTTIDVSAATTALQTRLRAACLWFATRKECLAFMGVMNAMPHTADPDTPTACASPKGFFYGTQFCGALSIQHLRGVMLHEVLHLALGHLTDYQAHAKVNPRKANIAMDYVVNAYINFFVTQHRLGTEIALPESALYDEKFIGLSYIDVYNLLYDKGEQPKPRGKQIGDGDAPMDDHVQGEDAGLTPEETKAISEAAQRAIQQAEAMGSMLGVGDTSLGSLLAPKVDWRKVMREFVKTVTRGSDISTWRRFNRRMASIGVYLPSHYSERIGGGMVAVDTSGSVTTDMLRQFMGETSSLAKECNPTHIDVVYWGSSVVGRDRYDKQTYADIARIDSAPNGGGTDPSKIMPYVVEHKLDPQWIVVLTDGYFDNPKPFGIPTLWVVYDNPKWIPPFGKVAHV